MFCRSTDPGANAVVVPDSMCRQHHRPKAQETCVLRRCPKNEKLQWIPTPWGEVTLKGEPFTESESEMNFVERLFWQKHFYLLFYVVAYWCVCLSQNAEEITSKKIFPALMSAPLNLEYKGLFFSFFIFCKETVI